MLARDFLREHTDDYRLALKNRGAKVDLERFLELDGERRRTIASVEQLKNQRNVASQEIAALKKNKEDASAQIEAMKRVGDEIKELDARVGEIEEELNNLELYFPNVPDASVPVGPDETHNRIERTWGEKPQFAFTAKPHWDLGEALGIIDFDRATKITGARFAILSGAGAQLSRALMSFMLDTHTSKGYREILTPFMVNADSMRGTGQLPKFEEDLFKLAGEKQYYLIPTAEVPVHEPLSRRDPRCVDAHAVVLFVLPLFPQRGRLVRQGHARPDPPASVREGRAGEVHDAGKIARGA